MIIAIGIIAASLVAIVACAAKSASKSVSERNLASAYSVRGFWLTWGWTALLIGGLAAITAPLPFPIPAPVPYELFGAVAVALLGLAVVRSNSGTPQTAVLRHAAQLRQVKPEDLMQQGRIPERKAVAALEEMAKAGLLVKQGGEGIFATYVLPQDKK
jgi:hypothetical protein